MLSKIVIIKHSKQELTQFGMISKPLESNTFIISYGRDHGKSPLRNSLQMFNFR